MSEPLILDRLVEGACPRCGAVLRRETGCGWCETCHVGWSMRADPDHPEYPLFYLHTLTGNPVDFEEWAGTFGGEADYFAEAYDERRTD